MNARASSTFCLMSLRAPKGDLAQLAQLGGGFCDFAGGGPNRINWLVLLRHKWCCPLIGGIGPATGTSRQGFGKRVDQACAHGRDRVWNVAFRPQGRILWVENLRVRQVSGTERRNEVLRGESSPAR